MKNLISLATFLWVAAFSHAQDNVEIFNMNISHIPQVTVSFAQAQTFAVTNQYLIVIDNRVATLHEFQQLQSDNTDPNDIASFDIRTTGAASQIYGARASSGVILISTTQSSSSESQTNITLNSHIQ
jgi:hypothetical protein